MKFIYPWTYKREEDSIYLMIGGGKGTYSFRFFALFISFRSFYLFFIISIFVVIRLYINNILLCDFFYFL